MPTTDAERGIDTVIDMHQDAYSSFISTADPAECPPGTKPAKGWDGAPRWATLTDGLSTCIRNERNDSPAVVAAWNHFADDTDGIRLRVAATWGAVAERFAGRPWDTEPGTLAEVERFAEDQDRLALGGAWWQWRQPCRRARPGRRARGAERPHHHRHGHRWPYRLATGGNG